MPTTASGVESMWVTTCKVFHNPDVYQAFPVSVFYGSTKPVNGEVYMSQFIDELNFLLVNGIIISGKHFNVILKCFVCDTPARAFINNTIGHTGTYACERCTVKGTKKRTNTTVYPSLDAPERTDESFRRMDNAAHHHGPSPVLRIESPISIIFFFILDFMHLCLQGVIKKLIE